jgi:hypothetical protein
MTGVKPTTEVESRYLLEGLAWCGLCGVPVEPAPVAPGKRFYGCRSILCVRSPVPADLLETLVWQAFQYLFVEPGVELDVDDQRQALEHSLARVTVGADLGELRYWWREVP